MPAVGQIETLIADGEIRYVILPDRERYGKPVSKGGVLNPVMTEPALAIGLQKMKNLSSPAFDHGKRHVIGCRGTQADLPGRRLGRAFRFLEGPFQHLQGFHNPFHGVIDFANT